MSSKDMFFVEVDNFQRNKQDELVSGDVYLHKRLDNHTILVMASGAGYGIKANIMANLIASMALNYAELEDSAGRCVDSIISTFSDDRLKMSYLHETSLTVADININGRVRVLEFDNPEYILIRKGKNVNIEKQKVELKIGTGVAKNIYQSEFIALPEDRIVLVSEGVILSGSGTKRTPQGWGREGIISLMEKSIVDNPTISAHSLTRKIIGKSEMNDLFAIKSDMSCVAVYFRQPRRMLVCSGPPFNEANDRSLADLISKHQGTKIICGGTTAQIVSRELNHEITVNLKRDMAGLPPTSTMEGVDLITEGVLTLNKVKSMLERIQTTEINSQGTDADLCRMLLQHDQIEFVIGTRINPIHQDPNLPVELELRRNIIKEMGRILEAKFMKKVEIRFM